MKQKDIDAEIKKLETILEDFEKGNITITESIETYKEAKKIVENLKKKLKEIELQIEEME